MSLPQQIRLGIILIVLAALIISLQDLVFKAFVQHLSLWQVFAVRGLIAVPLFLILIRTWQQQNFRLSKIAEGFAPWPLLRSITFTLTLLAFYAALPKLSFATVGAANYTAPLFVALLSALVIGERMRWVGWLGVAIGFGGLLLLLQPGTDAFSPWIFLPVIGAVSYAISHVITRTKCQHLDPLTLALSQSVMMMLSGFLVAVGMFIWQPGEALVTAEPQLFGPWPSLDWADVALLTLMAILTIAASTLVARSYQIAPPSIVATFEYSYLIFAAFWDSLSGDLPGPIGLTGIALIFLAGVLLLRTSSPADDSTPS